MKHALLIRVGGLAAMVGGVIYALEHASDAGQPPFILLLIAAMVTVASIVALILQRERYGSSGALASLIAFVGLALVLVGDLVTNSVTGASPIADWGLMFLILGILAATGGLVVLAIITINAGLLPWWGGAALIAGSPFGVLLLIMFPSWLSESLVEEPLQQAVEALPGVLWALVGYAIFRASTRLPEQPSRAR